MTSLQALPGFDWTKVRWSGPHDPLDESCSYCGAAFGEDEVPLRLMGERFAAFCENCQEKWWGKS